MTLIEIIVVVILVGVSAVFLIWTAFKKIRKQSSSEKKDCAGCKGGSCCG